MKRLSRIGIVTALSFAFTILSSVYSWGETVSFVFTGANANCYATSGSVSNISFETGKTGSATATAYNVTNGLVLYGVSDGGGYFNTTSKISGSITNISITTNNKKNSPKYTVYGSTTGSSWTQIGNQTDGGSTANFETSAGYKFIKIANTTGATAQLGVNSIIITYTPSGTPTTTSINASCITNTNKYISTEAGSLSASVTYGSPAASVPNASVTWGGNNDAVATINSTSGVVTLVGAGSVTFTASYAGANGYNPSADTYVMTVTNVNPALSTIWSEDFASSGYSTRASTYGYVTTGSSAVQSGDSYAGGDAPEMMVKTGGTFKAVIPLLTDTYSYSGDLTLEFKSNAKTINVKTTTSDITVDGEASAGAGVSFNTANTHSVTFKGVTETTESITIVFTATSSDNVRLDDIVLKGEKSAITKVSAPLISPSGGAVVSGTEVSISCVTVDASIFYTTDGSVPSSTSLAYNPSSKPTITANTTIKAIAIKEGLTDSDVATASFTIAVPCSTPTFSLAAGEVAKGATVTITTETEGATIYYTTDGNTPTTGSSAYSGAITINSAMTIKAIAVKDGNLNSEIASASYTLIDYLTLPFGWQGGASGDLTGQSGVTGSGLGGDYAESNAPYRVKMDSANDYVTIKTDSKPGRVFIGVKMLGGATTSKIKVQESTDGSTFKDIEEFTISGSQNDTKDFVTTKAFKAESRYVKIIKSVHGSNIGLGPITITKGAAESSSVETVVLSATLNDGRYWTTFYNGTTRYTLPEGAEAFIMEKSTYKLYRLGDNGREIPAGIAVIIIADSDSLVLEKSTSDADVSTHNVELKLEGSNYATPDSKFSNTETPYVLGVNGGVLGFYIFNGSAIPAMKAYYVVKNN